MNDKALRKLGKETKPIVNLGDNENFVQGKKKYSEFPPPGSAVLALAFKKPYPVKTANPVVLKVGDFSPPGRGHLARLF